MRVWVSETNSTNTHTHTRQLFVASNGSTRLRVFGTLAVFVDSLFWCQPAIGSFGTFNKGVRFQIWSCLPCGYTMADSLRSSSPSENWDVVVVESSWRNAQVDGQCHHILGLEETVAVSPVHQNKRWNDALRSCGHFFNLHVKKRINLQGLPQWAFQDELHA